MNKITFVATICLAIVSNAVLAQGTLTTDGCGTANSIQSPGTEDHLVLQVRDTCFHLTLIDHIDFRNGIHSAWENTTWERSPAGAQQAVFLEALPPYDIFLTTLAFDNVSMDPGGNRFQFIGNPISLTLDNTYIDLGTNPVWTSIQSLTLAANSGTNVIYGLKGNQAPTTALSVASGASLQFVDSGTLGQGLPDNVRLNFNSGINTADIQGSLDIHRSHVIFTNGGSPLLVHNGATLSVTGSADSTFETGGLTVDGGSLNLGVGSNHLIAADITLNDASVSLGDNAQFMGGTTIVTGTNTAVLGNNTGGFITEMSTDVLAMIGTLALSGYGKLSTPAVLLSSSDPGASLQVGGSTTLQIISGGGASNAWTGGNLNIGSDALVQVDAGVNVASQIPIANDGAMVVDGRFQPEGSMTGSGFLRIRAGGELGALGGSANSTFSIAGDLFMDDGSTFSPAINPTAGENQQLSVGGTLGLSGSYLVPRLIDDIVLSTGTKFILATYPGGAISGVGLRGPGGNLLAEGDEVSYGANTYVLSYADADAGGNAITLTVSGVATYAIGFSLTGLVSSNPPGNPDNSVVLVNNGADAITVFSDGSFSFSTELVDGAAYNITIDFQPANQICAVSDGSGTVAGAPVTDPVVTCSDDSSPTPPTARVIPTMPLWLMAIMGMALVAMGARGIGRNW